MGITIQKARFIFLIFSLVGLLFSCSPKDTKPSQNQLLTNRSIKKWVRYSQKTNGIEQLSNCDKDNVWSFSMNGNIVEDPGVIRCSINQPNLKYGFLLAGPNNESFFFKIYYITSSGEEFVQTYRGRIIELTDKSFIFRVIFVSLDGSTYYNDDYYFTAYDVQ